MISRPIAVDGEVAQINLNNNVVDLAGQIVSLGSGGSGIGTATGVSDMTIEDNSTAGKGVLVLAPSTGSNPLFYGNLVITSGTLVVSSDAAMGNTTGAADTIGQIELNGGVFQAGA